MPILIAIQHQCTLHTISNILTPHYLLPIKFFLSSVSLVPIHSRFSKAIVDPKWRRMMEEESKVHTKNGRWDLVDLPNVKELVGHKWLNTMKHKADGLVEHYKARLIAKGFTQKFGIDYKETFPRVAK